MVLVQGIKILRDTRKSGDLSVLRPRRIKPIAGFFLVKEMPLALGLLQSLF